VDVYCN